MMFREPRAGAALLFGAVLALMTAGPGAAARPAPDGFADLAARLLPSVVNVSTAETVSDGGGDDDDGDGSPAPSAPSAPVVPPGSPFEKLFREFMRDHGGGAENGPGGSQNNGQAAAKHRVQSLGSGFVVDPAGLIVTNNHVVKGADSVTVTLQDNSVLKATVVGHDDRTDLALLRVDPPHPLPAVSFGDSDRVRVGDWVVAIGNPFGLSGTVTAGIVSSRGRSLDDGPYDDFIQTDAPINRGNSGGPLFDTGGAVIGINTAIYSPSGGSIGIGFSIPASEAEPVIEQLKRFGRTRRGWIGVRVQDLGPELAAGLALPNGTRGALVAGLDADGPAARAGIRTGDVIERVNNEAVDGRSLSRVVSGMPPGAAVPAVLWRNGAERTLPVTVERFPEPAAPVAAGAGNGAGRLDDAAAALPELGMGVAALGDVVRGRFNIADDQKGVAVANVDPGGAAAAAGIRTGDVVVQADGDPVSGPKQLRERIDAVRHRGRGAVVVLLVQNGDGVRWVPLRLSAAVAAAGPVPAAPASR